MHVNITKSEFVGVRIFPCFSVLLVRVRISLCVCVEKCTQGNYIIWARLTIAVVIVARTHALIFSNIDHARSFQWRVSACTPPYMRSIARRRLCLNYTYI